MADYSLRVTSGRVAKALEGAKLALKTRWGYDWTQSDQDHFEDYVKPYIQGSIWRGVGDISDYIYAMYELDIPGTDSNRWRLAVEAGWD
eukprot:SAG11_NODE_14363_length_614_cov_40.473786_2_plen_89_part_00